MSSNHEKQTALPIGQQMTLTEQDTLFETDLDILLHQKQIKKPSSEITLSTEGVSYTSPFEKKPNISSKKRIALPSQALKG